MICFIYKLGKHCMLTSKFLLKFSNVIKLKGLLYGPRYKQTIRDRYSVSQGANFHSLTLLPLGTNTVMKNMCCCNARYFSKWTKVSQTKFLLNENSKKKHRIKSIQLAENMKKKFQSAKKETRRKVAKKMDEIKENILTVPNGLCVLRIVSTPILGYLVLSEFYTMSLGLFVLAGFTDMVDGFIARTFPNQQSMIGSFLDPAADKLLIATLFITLTINGLIPVPLTSLIIFRDACLMGAGFYIRYVSLPPPKTLSRYFNMSFVTARLSPTAFSKANTFLQLSLVAASLAAPVFNYMDHLYLHVLWYITGTTTVLSAVSYLYYKNSTYKLFTSLNEKQEK